MHTQSTHPTSLTGSFARLGWGVLAALLFAALVHEAIAHGAWAALAAGLVAPDLALLPWAGSVPEHGRLAPRAVPLYNALHRFWGPAALIAAAALGLLAGVALVAGLAWASHVALDRAVGYGLRTPEGYQRAA